MKTMMKTAMIAGMMFLGTAVFAGPHHHHKRDGLDLAAGIVNLVMQVVAPPQVVVAPAPVVTAPVVVTPAPVIRYNYAAQPVYVYRPAPPPRHNRHRPAPPPRHHLQRPGNHRRR